MPYTNFIYGPIYGIRDLMANSAAFRTAVSAATVNDAKAVIYPFQAFDSNYDADNTTQARPRVLLSYDGCATEKSAVSSWRSAYSVRADFEFPIGDDDEQTEAEAFLTVIDNVVEEMLALESEDNGGANTYITVDMVEAADCVTISDPDEEEGGVRFLWYGVKFIRDV